VLAGERLLGVVNVADRRDREPFSADDLRTVVLLSKDLGAAIERVGRLEASEDRHQQFVSRLAHELRNPLDGVLRFINLTLADSHPEERRRRYLLASKQGLERLTGIVNSMRSFYGDGAERCGPADVNELVSQAVTLQEGKAQQRRICARLDLAEGLPTVPGGGPLFQVFTNLVSNAYDAMESHGGTLSARSRLEGDSIVVRFADTGRGMTREVLERIFTPFFTTKPSGRGMGIGLAVCRELLRRCGGSIRVESKPGAGTTFIVVVPCTST
jgi:signal transduction histidine kinase